MWNAWSIHHRPGRDQHYLMTKRSSGRKQKVCWFRSMCWTDEGQKDGKIKWKDSSCICLTKTQWELTEKQLNSSGKFPLMFIIVYSSRDPERLGEKEHPARGVQRQDHLHVNVQWHWVENDENCISNAEKSRITRWTSRKDVGHSWVHGRKRSGMEVLLMLQKRRMKFNSQQPWCSDSKKLVILCSKVSVPCVVQSWRRRKERIPFTFWWRFDEHRTLVPNNSLCESDQVLTEQWRIGANNSASQRKRRDEIIFLWTQVYWQVYYTWSTTFGISLPTMASVSSLQENTLNFEALSKRIQFSKLCEDARFEHRVSAGMYYRTRHHEYNGWGRSVPLCRE